MSIFRAPSDYPWHFVIVLYVASIASGLYWLGLDLVPHAWAIPSEQQLTIAQGHFEPIKPGIKSPYIFATDSGARVALGCLPESAMASCLADAGISLNELSRVHSEIGYFRVQNWRISDLSNVLMTLSAGGRPLLTYADSQEKWQLWSVREEEIKHSFFSLGAAAFLPAALLVFALWLTLSKRSNKDDAHDLG